MSNSVIRVTDLGKKFYIGHQIDGDLRSSLINKFKFLLGGKKQLKKEEFWALRGVSFDVKQGEAIGIIGSNGAGKSTLLKILSRITAPTTGRFEINGRVSSLLEVGTGFHPELTGRENIYLNGTILGMRRAEIKSKFDEIIDFSGVEKFIDTPVKHYSSGMKVRLAFSVAAYLEPEILIVDEVLAVGDAEFQKKCLGKMSEVSRNGGKTVLFVSHNMSAVENFCKRGIVLVNGAIGYSGNTLEAVNFYLQNLTKNPLDYIWENKNRDNRKAIEIISAHLRLLGRQPCLKLIVETKVISNYSHQMAFIAFDVLSEDSIPLFQAIPSSKPFVVHSKDEQLIKSAISLPPLIPGNYKLSIWVGSHYTDTYDWAQDILSFNIDISPMHERTHPHSKRNGFLVPFSEIIS